MKTTDKQIKELQQLQQDTEELNNKVKKLLWDLCTRKNIRSSMGWRGWTKNIPREVERGSDE